MSPSPSTWQVPHLPPKGRHRALLRCRVFVHVAQRCRLRLWTAAHAAAPLIALDLRVTPRSSGRAGSTCHAAAAPLIALDPRVTRLLVRSPSQSALGSARPRLVCPEASPSAQVSTTRSQESHGYLHIRAPVRRPPRRPAPGLTLVTCRRPHSLHCCSGSVRTDTALSAATN